MIVFSLSVSCHIFSVIYLVGVALFCVESLAFFVDQHCNLHILFLLLHLMNSLLSEKVNPCWKTLRQYFELNKDSFFYNSRVLLSYQKAEYKSKAIKILSLWKYYIFFLIF